jgi:hypothetical protein
MIASADGELRVLGSSSNAMSVRVIDWLPPAEDRRQSALRRPSWADERSSSRAGFSPSSRTAGASTPSRNDPSACALLIAPHAASVTQNRGPGLTATWLGERCVAPVARQQDERGDEHCHADRRAEWRATSTTESLHREASWGIAMGSRRPASTRRPQAPGVDGPLCGRAPSCVCTARFAFSTCGGAAASPLR